MQATAAASSAVGKKNSFPSSRVTEPSGSEHGRKKAQKAQKTRGSGTKDSELRNDPPFLRLLRPFCGHLIPPNPGLDDFRQNPTVCPPPDALIVYRLGQEILNLQSGVRFPVGAPSFAKPTDGFAGRGFA